MGKKKNQHKKKKVVSNCGLCTEPDEGEMVQCDTCDTWYHFTCVDLSNIEESETWICPECDKKEEQQTKQRNRTAHHVYDQTSHDSPRSSVVHGNRFETLSKSENESRNQGAVRKDPNRQMSSYTSSDRRLQVELQRIEEEKFLQQKMQAERHQLQQDYLEKKYELLMKFGSRNSVHESTKEMVKPTTTVSMSGMSHSMNEGSEFDIEDFVRRLDELKFSPMKDESSIKSRVTTPEVKKTKTDWADQGNEFVHSTSVKDPDQPKAKLTKSSSQSKISTPPTKVLSKAQIAARQVVTKDLPHFYGKPEDWMIFYKRYTNSTDLCGYSDAENLDRLQKCIKGTAYEAVQDLLLDVESVKDIITTLETLFGRPEIIVKRLLDKIRQLPKPKADNLNSMVKFALDVQNLSKTIERKDLKQYLHNPLLLQELVERLPTTFKVDWAKHIAYIPDQQVNISTLSDWLQRLLKALIKVTEYVAKEPDKKNEKKQKSSTEHVNIHQEAKTKTEEIQKKVDVKSETERNCVFCKKSCKAVQDCEAFKSLQPAQRWNAMFENKLCRRCLRRHAGFCRLNKECGTNNCKNKHHPLLHNEEIHNRSQNVSSNSEMVKADVIASHISINNEVILRIIPVKVYGNGICIDTFAFLDDGSTATLIEEKLANDLKLSGATKNLCLIWSAHIHRREKNSRQVNVMISSNDNPKIQWKLRDVKTVECLGIPSQQLNKEKLCSKFPYLRNVPFMGYENGLPRILIGSNNPKVGIPREVKEGGDFEPIAARTNIGWTIHGHVGRLDSDKQNLMNHYTVEECQCLHEHDESLHQSLKDYFSIDNFGVQISSSTNTISKDEERALQLLEDNTKRIDKQFETSLLWRYENFEFPESYSMARRRLECLENKNPETIKIIDDTINDYIKKGYARKLSKQEATDHKQRHWYLPVFTVTYPKKPDKHRMVFDAAAKVRGVSLNSMLLKGPDQLVSLVEILRRFREKCYAVCGDIREMFPQVKIKPEDQQCQRFLWRNGDKSKDPDVYIMLVMTFGAACSPCTAHFIKNRNAADYSKEFPRAAEAIIHNHYMDDMMERENSEEELIQLVKDVKQVHLNGGFEIRNFLSNSKKFMKVMGCNTQLNSKNINPDKEYEIERVLGMWWNVNTDNFTFSLKFLSVNKEILSGEKLPTKRELLKLLMSIFDPLGLISNYLIHLKILIQDVWRSKLEWDQQISTEELIDPWKKWLQILPTVENIQIPRFYTPKLTSSQHSTEIHTFVDASENAFGAVTYLRVEDESGVDCTLMGSKSRVAPLKYLSIPRKELQSGLLGSRLVKNIVGSQTFKVNRRIFWTDSSTLLSWLRSDQRKYHQFVAHRIGEILEDTNLIEWRWVPSKLNVADELTKWPKHEIFDSSSCWFKGPAFLKESEDKWPVQKDVDILETQEEMKLMYAHRELIITPFCDASRFSNWNRMIRAVAYSIRFTKILKARIAKQQVQWSHLTQEELVQAENIIFRQAQFDGFLEEMITLELNTRVEPKDQQKIPKSSPLISCSPYLDEFGVLRVRGRIDLAANIPTETKRPIILPRHGSITKLLVGSYHKLYHHRNQETVVNEIRQKFYIPKLRVVLKSFITNDCQRCKNRRAKPDPPEEGNLPAGRMAVGFRPFTHTGIDYFGPISVVQGRSRVKRWGVIFTCLTIRAIHIEIAYSMTTQTCIKMIRNFINLRGHPSEFYSDCGTNLVGTDNELQRALEDVDVQQLAANFTTSYCKWNFNPPEAKHMGGAWERLIRSVKICLYDIMPTRTPSDEMLRSLLMEAVNVVNSRPLTFIPLDNSNEEALTPNHFIFGSSNGLKPPGDFISDGPILHSEWKELQRLSDNFWRRFVKEYLPTLTRKTKWFHPVPHLAIGDVVLVIDEKNSRNIYPKARILETVIGSNDQVRRVRLQFANGSVLWRPASGVARLDISPTASSTVVPDRQTGGTVARAE